MSVKLFVRRFSRVFLTAIIVVIVSLFCAVSLDRPGKAASAEGSLPPAATTATVTPLSKNANKPAVQQNSSDKPAVLAQGINYLTLANIPVTIYLPANLKPSEPSQLLMAFHGMGGNGQDMCNKMTAFAEQNNVIVIAPTFSFNPDYTNIEVVRSEDIQVTAKINDIVADFVQTSKLQLKDRYLLYGFSRGAQIVHRFATFYPQKVFGVAVLAAGTYTLPLTVNKATNAPLGWPYGVADLQNYGLKPFDKTGFQKVHFWLEVGEQDTDPKGLSRSWDSLSGTTRFERSKNYYQALKQLDVDAHWTSIPNTGHSESSAMRAPALNFFSKLLERSSDAAKPAATKAGAVYFQETGHNLGGVFRKYWETHGGLAQFGYPLTEEFREVSVEDNNTYTVQYFERARFEHHPEFAGTNYEVELGLLGKQFAPQVPPISQEFSPFGSLYFKETSHSLGGVFEKYWKTHGGLAMYGYPITEPFEEKNPDDGKIYQVQYFERNRFEYHPEFAGTNNEVLLGLLGKLDYALNYM